MKLIGSSIVCAAIVMSVPALAIEVTKTADTTAKPGAAWTTVGDFCAIADWHPAVEKCEENDVDGKKQRSLTLAGGGGTIVEELESRDDAGMKYTYKILSGPLPVANYVSTISVSPKGDGSELTWTGTFDAKGASDADAEAAIAGVYEGGLKGIADKAAM